jgi:hypothetical protein
MIPLLVPLLVALALTQVPSALADVLEGDSSGKQHPSEALSLCLCPPPPGRESGISFSPTHLLPALGDPGKRQNWEKVWTGAHGNAG